jgi:F-type H+-transporting ATPase subunit gamma
MRMGYEDAVVMTNLKNKQKFSQYLYEPNRDFILETILYKLLSIQIYQAILESKASEESARMVAMKNASENSQKITDELNLRYNRLRQAGITSEIIDISLGALAINQDN